MDTSVKLTAAATGLFLAAANCNAQTRAGDTMKIPETVVYSKKTLLKNWALYSCLSAVTKNKEDDRDIGITLGTYFDFAEQDVKTYRTLGKLADKYAKRKYNGTHGSVKSDFNTMKCMDMYYRKELDRLVVKLLKTRYKY